jgi:hypothetical protein
MHNNDVNDDLDHEDDDDMLHDPCPELHSLPYQMIHSCFLHKASCGFPGPTQIRFSTHTNTS